MSDELRHEGALTPERSAFITKVYGLVGLSLLCGVGGTFIGGQLSLAYWMPLRLIALLIFIAAMFCRHVRGWNVGLLFGWSLFGGMASGTFLVPMMAHSAHFTSLVVQAGITTFGTFGALSAYVFWTRRNFSYLRTFVFTAMWSLFLVGIVGVIFGMPSWMYGLYLYAMLLMLIGFVLYDTSNLIDARNGYAADDYAGAALDLYWDLLHLFWTILQIFMSRDD